MDLMFDEFAGGEDEEIDGALHEELRWHGLIQWTPPAEITPGELKPKRMKPIGLRVRIGPRLWEMAPPYLFKRHPVPTPAELAELFQ